MLPLFIRHRGKPPITVSSPTMWRLRGWWNWTLMGIAIAVLIEVFGSPSIVTTYKYRGERGLSNATEATYVGMTGQYVIPAESYESGCPVIVWMPLEKSLLAQAKEGLTEILESITENSKDQ